MISALPPWPTARSTRAAFEERFGTENADFMQDAMNTGDPLADAVVEAIREDGNPEEWKLEISASMKACADRLGTGIGGQTSYQAAAAGTLDSHVI